MPRLVVPINQPSPGSQPSCSWMLFPVWPRRTLAPPYAISRLGPRTAASNCGRRHGGHTGWRGSENSRRGLVGEIISPLLLRRARVRVMGRVRVKIGLGVGFGLGL